MNKNKYITLVSALLLLLFNVKAQAQCGPWNVAAVADSSTCLANGKISVTITGTASLSDTLYSLTPVVAGGYSVSPNTSSLFENIPAGSYNVLVQAICNGTAVSNTITVNVPGNYQLFTAGITLQRIALHSCNTGQLFVSLAKGRLPYSVSITGAPAGYSGRTSFTTRSNFVIDSLPAGAYTISVSDACGNTPLAQTMTVTELPVMTKSNFSYYGIGHIDNSCNRFYTLPPIISRSNAFYPYGQNSTTPLTYSIAYDTMAKLPYRPLVDDNIFVANNDTITLPAGQTFKNIYGKSYVYYIKSPCGEEASSSVITIASPSLSGSYTLNCAVNFDETYAIAGTDLVCYPVYLSVKNNTTNVYRYDTITNGFSRTIKGLAFGSYTFTAITSDGYTLPNYAVTVSAPVTVNPYSVSKFPYAGDTGNDGAGYFQLAKSNGNFSTGTIVKLISPSDYIFSVTTAAVVSNGVTAYEPQTGSSKGYFYPGDYVFRVIDACDTFDLPITLTENDVYRYNWKYTELLTCSGKSIKPTGTCTYNGVSKPVYFKILQGPNGTTGYDNSIHAQGDSLLLPVAGNYKIGIGSSSTILNDYGTNTKIVSFIYSPLAVDINRSLGWICPGKADNSGEIRAFALNGSTAATGHYTFRLAALGNGATGPYLASNTTGRFSTATSSGAYTLIKNQNYDIRVEDECGAAAVQSIKIIDFATAQLAFADKAAYCIGETATFGVINLPTTAISFKWTGPDYFSSTSQNPVLKKVKTSSKGDYNVVISSDICEQPINATVHLALAPYIQTCYSAVTDTSVNPYAYGLLGNWHATRSYTYYGARAESDPTQETDIRHDGTFADFTSFWQVQNDKWNAVKDTTRWVWNAESTLFNAKGMELENKDPLGRYNAGIYGYDDAIPVAVIQNSRFREAAYEGFEDYSFGSNTCDTACSSDRRFDFSPYKSKIDSSQKHTGRYSLRLEKTDTLGLKAIVTDIDSVATDPVFKKGIDSACGVVPVLKSVNADKGVLLPSFSPLSGKKVLFSAWVKEANDCNCGSYVSNKVTLAVSRSTGNTIIVDVTPTGGIIDGWQRYEQVVELPVGATGFSVVLMATGTTAVYFDDIRIHPYNANMKSFVYDAKNLRLMAELDENNYATFYEYDDDGTLTRVKKETERGIKTIKETRSALIKE